MIPKILHYCWFGHGPMTNTAKKCMKSWLKKLPDYQFKEWNETNFDIHINQYVEEAYNEKEFRFVSDYARLYALYTEGGIYLDVDCKVIKSFNPLLNQKGFTSFGGDNREIAACTIAVEKGLQLIKECLDSYSGESLYKSDGTVNGQTINIRITEILKKYGFRDDGTEQDIKGLHIYPMTYFCPIGFLPETVPDCISKDTYSMTIWTNPRLRFERSLFYRLYKRFKRYIQNIR